jgi:IS605 OrfB family transposase
MLATYQGEADLVLRDGEFYLCQTCEINDQKTTRVDELLGVDLGLVNLATTSDGQNFTGAEVEDARLWYEQRRQVLQKVGTQSSRRRLRRMSQRQRRFQKHTNHTISKQIVETAKGTGRGVALENLKGIRTRTRLHRQQRSRQSNWSFGQLRAFIAYKAKLLGVPVIYVDPRDTSKTCSVCSHCDKANRPTRDEFNCLRCGHAAPADVNAAVNIAARAAVNRPMVPDASALLV